MYNLFSINIDNKLQIIDEILIGNMVLVMLSRNLNSIHEPKNGTKVKYVFFFFLIATQKTFPKYTNITLYPKHNTQSIYIHTYLRFTMT